MKALKQIGIKKACSFIGYALLAKALHCIVFPQVRGLVLSFFGAKIGKDTIIGDVHFSNLYHYGFKKIEIADRCFVADEVLIDTRGGVVLGHDVTVSNRVNIITHINVGYQDHPIQKHYPTKEAPVVIKSGAYIGTAATILPGVTIGAESVIAAGAVVTNSVSTRTVVAGVPAKVIKKIS